MGIRTFDSFLEIVHPQDLAFRTEGPKRAAQRRVASALVVLVCGLSERIHLDGLPGDSSDFDPRFIRHKTLESRNDLKEGTHNGTKTPQNDLNYRLSRDSFMTVTIRPRAISFCDACVEQCSDRPYNMLQNLNTFIFHNGNSHINYHLIHYTRDKRIVSLNIRPSAFKESQLDTFCS